MAIAFRTSATNTSNVFTVTIAKADLSGLADTDFVLIHYTADTDLSWGTVESGWTKVDEKLTTAGRDLTSGYFYKQMTDVSSEPATWTFGNGTNTEKVLVATVWTGVDSVDYLDVLATSTDGTNDSTPDGLDITTTVDGAMIVSSCHLADPEDVSSIVGGAPSELTIADYDIIYVSDTAFCAVAYLLKTSLGAQSIGAWTNTNDNATSEWHCRTLSLNPPTPVFADIRQDIIDGLDSAQSEGTGWNAEVRDKIPVTDVVRTSNTVVTITLTAAPDYDITAQETIEVTVPASALTGAEEIVAEPTFTVDIAVSGDVSVDATTDTLVITENIVGIKADTTLQPGYDALVITENNAVVDAEINIAATTDALILTENAATIKADTTLQAGVDALVITENTVTVDAEINVAAAAGSITITENAATVSLGFNVEATTDALVITENTVTIKADTTLQAGVDTLVITENQASINAETNVNVSIDPLILTELAATISAETNLQSGYDTLLISENSATISLLSAVSGRSWMKRHSRMIIDYEHLQ